MNFLLKHTTTLTWIIISILLLRACSNLLFEEHEVSDHKMIGEVISFNKPMLYYKNGSAFFDIDKDVPFELFDIDEEYYLEAFQYVPSTMEFKVKSAHYCSDFEHGASVTLVLEDSNNFKSTIDERFIKSFNSSNLAGCKGPNKLLDELNMDNKNVKLSLYIKNFNSFPSELFNKCSIKYTEKDFHNYEVIVDKTKLMCIYDRLWQRNDCKKNPVLFDIL